MHKSVQSEILRMGVPSNIPPGPDCVAEIEWLNVAAGLLPEAEDERANEARCPMRTLRTSAKECNGDALGRSDSSAKSSCWHRLSSAVPSGKNGWPRSYRRHSISKGAEGHGALWQGLFSGPRLHLRSGVC